jgi:hypothetical protein
VLIKILKCFELFHFSQAVCTVDLKKNLDYTKKDFHNLRKQSASGLPKIGSKVASKVSVFVQSKSQLILEVFKLSSAFDDRYG